MSGGREHVATQAPIGLMARYSSRRGRASRRGVPERATPSNGPSYPGSPALGRSRPWPREASAGLHAISALQGSNESLGALAAGSACPGALM